VPDAPAAAPRYVLALKREARARAPADWQERIRAIEGVRAGGSASALRMQIEASEDALARIGEEFGELLRVEPVRRRTPL